MELGKDFFIPIISKAHDIIEAKLLALGNGLVEEWIIESLKVFRIHKLARDNRSLALAQNKRGVEVLVKLALKLPF